MPEESPTPEQRAAAGRHLIDLINGYQASAAIGALARLGVADALADGPASVAELARRTGADERALARMLNVAGDWDLFVVEADGRVRLGGSGDLLRGDVPGSLRRLAIVSTEDWRWGAYGRLTHTLRTGEPGIVAAEGCRLWDYLASHPDAAASFQQTMARVGMARDQAVAAALDLDAVTCLVDVGGGRGELLSSLLAAHPRLRGVVLDLPGVIQNTREHLAEAGLAERCETIAGDFRDSVPEGGDAYMLSWILHDWDDEAALLILQNCRAAMQKGHRLLIVEMVVPEPGHPGAPGFERLLRQTDLEMLAVVGGRERTRAEYGELLATAGFALGEVRPLEGLAFSVIEGVAV
jgi:O-methyltransferase domain